MGDFRDSSASDILQFLLDQIIQSDQIEIELTRRRQITQCFQTLEYAPLPKKEELKHLSKVDDCVVCNNTGDLVCLTVAETVFTRGVARTWIRLLRNKTVLMILCQ